VTDPTTADPKPPRVRPARMTVRDMVYHQNPGDQPTLAETAFTVDLTTQEQPYRRPQVATQRWSPVDFGYLTEASHVVIENREGRFTQRVPTPEQREAAEAKVLEIAFFAGIDMHERPAACILVPPRQSIRVVFAKLGLVKIRSQYGDARYFVCAFPK
jgi:hypothetical protein